MSITPSDLARALTELALRHTDGRDMRPISAFIEAINGHHPDLGPAWTEAQMVATLDDDLGFGGHDERRITHSRHRAAEKRLLAKCVDALGGGA